MSINKNEFKMSLKVGDKVLISKSSRFYKRSDIFSNPCDTYGYIQGIKNSIGGLPIRVNWLDGTINTYSETDLIPVMDKCEIIINPKLRIVSKKCGLIAASFPLPYMRRKTTSKILPKKWIQKITELYMNGLRYIYVEYNSDHTLKRLIINPKGK